MATEGNISTKLKIADSFEKIIQTKALSKITVKDIMDDCGLSRRTFYTNFIDIYDLINWMAGLYIMESEDAYAQNKDFFEATLLCIEVFAKHSRFFKVACQTEGPNAFVETFTEYLIREGSKHVGHKNLTEDMALAVRIYWTGKVRVIVRWLQNGMQEPPAVLAKYICNALPESLRPFFRF